MRKRGRGCQSGGQDRRAKESPTLPGLSISKKIRLLIIVRALSDLEGGTDESCTAGGYPCLTYHITILHSPVLPVMVRKMVTFGMIIHCQLLDLSLGERQSPSKKYSIHIHMRVPSQPRIKPRNTTQSFAFDRINSRHINSKENTRHMVVIHVRHRSAHRATLRLRFYPEMAQMEQSSIFHSMVSLKNWILGLPMTVATLTHYY